MMLAELDATQFCYVPQYSDDSNTMSLFASYTGAEGTAMNEAMFNNYKTDYPCVTETYTDINQGSPGAMTKNEFETHTAHHREATQYQPPTTQIAHMNAKLFTAHAYNYTAKAAFNTAEKRKCYHDRRRRSSLLSGTSTVD